MKFDRYYKLSSYVCVRSLCERWYFLRAFC